MVHNAGPAFGSRPRPAWPTLAAEAAYDAQANDTWPGARMVVTVHHPLMATQPAQAC
jgi:hypothetical protein